MEIWNNSLPITSNCLFSEMVLRFFLFFLFFFNHHLQCKVGCFYSTVHEKNMQKPWQTSCFLPWGRPISIKPWERVIISHDFIILIKIQGSGFKMRQFETVKTVQTLSGLRERAREIEREKQTGLLSDWPWGPTTLKNVDARTAYRYNP